MRFASALIDNDLSTELASQQLIAQVRLKMTDVDPDFILINMSSHYRQQAEEIVSALRKALQPEIIIGCTAESVLTHEHEIEQSPSIALMAAHLPDVNLIPFHFEKAEWRSLWQTEDAIQERVLLPGDTKFALLLADPFTTAMDKILTTFNKFYPGLPLSGGLASGSSKAGGNVLILNDQVQKQGLVGVGFAGPIDVEVIVSQGCRPIGDPVRVKSAAKNIIMRFNDDQIPLKYLQEVLKDLSDEDRELLQNGLFIGRAINDKQEELGRGDFLIRGVIGVDQNSGALAVGDYMNRGETLQFQLRDAETALEDLEMMLTPQLFYDPPAGALLFTCNGRGTRLYDDPDGDISIVRNVFSEMQISGFFCAGEIGPIAGKNFLHGHTASLVLFRPEQTFDGPLG